MKKYRLISGILAAALLAGVVCLQGCIKEKNPNLKTYQEYVESLLNINYLGDYELYEQISGSNNGAEVHEACIADYTDAMINCFAIEESVLTDGQKNALAAISEELCGKASYVVDEAVLSDGIYTVQVNVKPLNYFETAKTKFDTYIDEFNNRAAQGEFLETSEEEYESEYAEGVIELLDAALDESTYSEETSYTVTILINEAGESYVGDDDLTAIDDLMFPDFE